MSLCFFVVFWGGTMSHGMRESQFPTRSGMELMPLAVEMQSPNHWTAILSSKMG